VFQDTKKESVLESGEPEMPGFQVSLTACSRRFESPETLNSKLDYDRFNEAMRDVIKLVLVF
jgi:hypothetical protein